MDILKIAGGALLALISIAIIIFTLMQDSKQPGMNAFTGQTDSYLSKNKSKTLEAKLVKVTRVAVIVFFVLAIGMNLAIAYLK